ncbi:MAG: hypothetical protein KAW12_20525 [Candidatus Aminicenantes bacterium]|nr:hypothetical protein [Candidatus Aminicenantes bacterium]
MEFIREIRSVTGREVTITLPEDFKETEVEILILPAHRDVDRNDKNKLEEDIIEALQEVKNIREGKAPEKTARELLSEL